MSWACLVLLMLLYPLLAIACPRVGDWLMDACEWFEGESLRPPANKEDGTS